MANPFTNFDWSWRSVGKAVGIGLLGLISLMLVISLVGFALRTILEDPAGRNVAVSGSAPEAAMLASDAKMALPPPAPDDEFVDQNAEKFEVEDWYVSYRPSSKTKICDAVAALKADPEIIFTSANTGDYNCNYEFKVAKVKAETVLAQLRDLKPDELNRSVYTIQKTVEGMTDELTIQKNKLAEIEKTLQAAQRDYDELSQLAKEKQDIESLTKLIDLKLSSIEKLSQQRLEISEQITRLEKARAEQLEKLRYTNFHVSVQEDRFIDWKQIVDSWKQQVQQLVRDFNEILQSLSVGLVNFGLQAVRALIYLFLAVGLLRLTWGGVKKIWFFRRKQ